MASTFAFLGISVRMVGILNLYGDDSLYAICEANGDSLVYFRLVVLYAHNTPNSSSTHFPLAECRHFFRVDRSVLLEPFA